MLTYTYECCKCGKKLEDVKCPKCGGEASCRYDPCFDDYE